MQGSAIKALGGLGSEGLGSLDLTIYIYIYTFLQRGSAELGVPYARVRT